MHRLLERLDGAASTIVPLAYLAGMLLGTAAYFSGLVLDAGVAVGIALALAVELHGFLEQRRVRALWGAHSRTPEGEARDRLFGELRAHAVILAGLVLFQGYNSLQFLGATWKPSPGLVPAPLQLIVRALVLPAAFLVSGALSPLTVDAGDDLRHAARAMLHRTLRATLRQWKSRIDRAARSNRDLAPIAVSLMLDAGDTDGARRITLIAEGLATSEQAPALLTSLTSSVRTNASDELGSPPRFPTGGGTPSSARGAPRRAERVTGGESGRPAVLRLAVPSEWREADQSAAQGSTNGRGVRTPKRARRTRTQSVEAKARAAWHSGMSVTELERAAGISRSMAGKYRKVFMAEADGNAEVAL